LEGRCTELNLEVSTTKEKLAAEQHKLTAAELQLDERLTEQQAADLAHTATKLALAGAVSRESAVRGELRKYQRSMEVKQRIITSVSASTCLVF
jgi:hypothetical protein